MFMSNHFLIYIIQIKQPYITNLDQKVLRSHLCYLGKEYGIH